MSRGIQVFIKNPHILFFIVAGTALFAACVNLHSSFLSADYEETTAYVSDLEEVRYSTGKGIRTGYNYSVTWYDDGEEYTKYFEKEVDPKEEGETTVWISPDNHMVLFHNYADLQSSSLMFWVIGIVSGAVGIFLYRRHVSKREESPEQTEERLEDTKMYSVMGIIFCLIGSLFFAWEIYQEHQEGYIYPMMWDALIAIAVIVAGCVVLFIRAKRKLKAMENLQRKDGSV